METDSQMLHSAKEELNQKLKLEEQLKKSDPKLNENIAKIGRTMEAIGNVMHMSRNTR